MLSEMEGGNGKGGGEFGFISSFPFVFDLFCGNVSPCVHVAGGFFFCILLFTGRADVPAGRYILIVSGWVAIGCTE